MSTGAFMLIVATVLVLGTLAFVLWSLVRSIRDERTGERSIWREFGLSLALMSVFFATWIGQLISEWQTYTDDQRSHGESTAVGDFVSHFLQSTLENWQSEFLQLFSFVTLAALYIHKGSGESKDSSDNVQASLRRIEEQLGILPPDAPSAPGEDFKLPDTALKAQDAVRGTVTGDDVTKEQLYEAAKDLDIAGRSSMNKDELARAVEDERGQT